LRRLPPAGPAPAPAARSGPAALDPRPHPPAPGEVADREPAAAPRGLRRGSSPHGCTSAAAEGGASSRRLRGQRGTVDVGKGVGAQDGAKNLSTATRGERSGSAPGRPAHPRPWRGWTASIGHRIAAAGGEGMAAGQAPHGKPAPSPRTMAADRLGAVGTAAGNKAAARPKQGGNPALIEPDQHQQQGRQSTVQNRRSTLHGNSRPGQIQHGVPRPGTA